MVLTLEPTPGGVALAAALVVAGAPLFSAGLRVHRLRRSLRDLKERPLAEAPTGIVQVRGRVVLDGPLVGPLSGMPCAGFVLEVRRGGAVIASIPERRTFRLVSGDTVARVLGDEGEWDLAVTGERRIAAHDPLTENLAALIARAPEVGLLRRAGVALTMVERALGVGQECSVIGHARHAQPYEVPQPIELGRTGTDALGLHLAAPAVARDPDLWITSGGHWEFLRISDRAIDPQGFGLPLWRLLGLGLGPLLTLSGLLYLTRAADQLRASGRF